jgi:myo-inositol-1-phosphate synthase
VTRPIRTGIVGVGNCANSLLQGIFHYAGGAEDTTGLVRPTIGGYAPADIEVVAAFDVTSTKVGRELSEAIWAFPNDTIRFAAVPPLKVTVHRGPTLDGLGLYISQVVTESDESVVDVARVLRGKKVDVLVNYLPVGSEAAARHYAAAALEAGCALVNCIPVFLSREWGDRFAARGIPIIGDDIKSQVGATIVHRVLASLFRDRGVVLDRTLQLNIGGNGDFLNMLERERLASKKTSKTNAVISVAGREVEPHNVHIGPSDYVQWLGDRKWAYIRLEGRGFGGAPINIELKLDVWDSPNSAGIVIDAVRCAQLARDRGAGGPLLAPSAAFMKSPPVQSPDDSRALADLEEFLR